MKTLKDAANKSAGLSRCDKCKYIKRCNETMIDICYNAHVRGFEKGYKYKKKQ